jgi:hypothetical protein
LQAKCDGRDAAQQACFGANAWRRHRSKGGKPMATISLDGLSVEYTVAYPYVSLDVSFRVPDGIPFVGGKSYSLGRVALTLVQTSVDLPIDAGPLSGSIRFNLDPSRCSFSIGGHVKLGPWRWNIGPGFAMYMTPFSLAEPSWSVNPVILDPAAFQARINSAPVGSVGSCAGAVQLQNDPATQQAIRSVFAFCGAGDFVDQMTATARHLGEGLRARQSARGSDTAAAADAYDPNMLVAFAVGLEGGAIVGLSGAYGIYFTTVSGDFGSFGSFAIDAGIIGEFAGGVVGFVYWAEGGNDAKGNFGGLNGFVTLEAGEGLSVGLTVYWPEDKPLHVTDDSPCGMGFTLGPGVGLPVNFFVGNSDTFLTARSPSEFA